MREGCSWRGQTTPVAGTLQERVTEDTRTLLMLISAEWTVIGLLTSRLFNLHQLTCLTPRILGRQKKQTWTCCVNVETVQIACLYCVLEIPHSVFILGYSSNSLDKWETGTNKHRLYQQMDVTPLSSSETSFHISFLFSHTSTGVKLFFYSFGQKLESNFSSNRRLMRPCKEESVVDFLHYIVNSDFS